MPDAELRQDRIHRSHLNASPSTSVAQFRCCDVICSVRCNKWNCGEAVDKLKLLFKKNIAVIFAFIFDDQQILSQFGEFEFSQTLIFVELTLECCVGDPYGCNLKAGTIFYGIQGVLIEMLYTVTKNCQDIFVIIFIRTAI
jgi:hypothetical protein